jgi:hypothetical protein
MQLYKVSDEYISILDAIEVAETDEEIQELEKQLAAIDGEWSDKAENICAIVKNLRIVEDQQKAQSSVMWEAAKEASAKHKAAENRRKRLQDYLDREMQRLKMDKGRFGIFNVYHSKTKEYPVFNEADVPIEYRKPGDPDTKLIEEELKAGGSLDWATLKATPYIVIK